VTRPLSAECRLVFLTADPRRTPAALAPLVTDVADWERVMAIAERELATSLLARTLHAIGTGVPAGILDDARRRALAIEVRMQYLSRRVQQTCAVLTSRDIPFILLKGTAVGALVDPTFCSRPMNDADVLVRPDDSRRAIEAIEAAGWSATTDEVLRTLLTGAQHLPPFLDPQMPDLRLELHVSHLPTGHPFAFDTSMLWRDARPAGEPFAAALVPSPEHLLLHAAVHFAWQHPLDFGAWRTFRVVALVSGVPGFSWERFATKALDARAATASFWTLRLASRLADIGAPPAVVRRLTPPTPEWVLDALERHFIATIAVGETPASPSVRLDHLLWLAAIRPRWSGHATSRHWDHQNLWGQAYGVASTEPGWRRFVRHLAEYRRWTSFLTGTLLGQRRGEPRSSATTQLAPPS